MERGRLFRISGVAGCGKTTTVALVRKLAREAELKYAHIDTKRILCELAGVATEREYRELPEEKRREFFPCLTREIANLVDRERERVWFFERHLCSMNADGTIIARGIPEEHGPRMVGNAVILAHQSEIAEWRERDRSFRHDRHMLTLDQIAEEQARETELAIDAGNQWGYPVQLFFNSPERGMRLADEIFAFMKHVAP
jgi:adenylate kinase